MSQNQSNFQWYILSVVTGREEKVKKEIDSELKKNNLEEAVSKWIIFNKKKGSQRILKGLIFCQANLNNQIVQIFYSIPGFISFLDHSRASKQVPNFVSQEMIQELLNKIELDSKRNEVLLKEEENISLSFRVGDLVKINKGFFASYEGRVTKVNERTKEVNLVLEYDGEKNLVNDIVVEKLSWSDCHKLSLN